MGRRMAHPAALEAFCAPGFRPRYGPATCPLDVETLGQSRNDFGKKLDGVLAHCASERHELKNIDSTLRPLDQRDKSLVLTHPLSDVSLRQSGGLPGTEQHIDKMLMSSGEYGLRQASLG